MKQVAEGSMLWSPTEGVKANANLTRYMIWLAENRNLNFDNYADLWQWSVDHIDRFWETIWHFFDLKWSQPAESILADRTMPGAKWFPGARLNYAENIFAKTSDDRPMLLYKAEDAPLVEISRQSVYDQANRLAQVLREMGVQKGDRVVAYLPNIPETIVAVTAVSSLGAIWSSCSPDFGSRSVLDRFTQIEPKVLIAVDGYSYGGKQFDRRDIVAELQAALPTLNHTILVPHIAHTDDGLRNTVLWDAALSSVTPPETM
ncbi:MAG: AMP-binding protein, partial [Anaerolineales bacterium]|nr:AMP-binding protein [Anaerolineales bacterium]